MKASKSSKKPTARKRPKSLETPSPAHVEDSQMANEVQIENKIEIEESPAVPLSSSEKRDEELRRIKTRPNRLMMVVLLLGWISDFLFWKHPIGVNFAIFSTLCLFTGFFLLIADGYVPARRSLWLLIPFVFFNVATFLRQEPLTRFLAYTFTLFSAGLFATTYAGGRWLQYGMRDYFERFLSLINSMFARPSAFFGYIRAEQKRQGNTIKLPVAAVLRGLLFAAPVVALFAFLLASADVVFNQRIADFFELFDAGRITEYTVRLTLVLICAYALSGAFLHAASKTADEKIAREGKPFVPVLGFTESSVVMGSVALLFLSFVTIQFQYFFGGQSNIGVAGYTYSEYARSGFNELVAVGFFSLLLIMGLSTITKRESDAQRKVYSWLGAAIAVEVLVILASAYQRLSLAIDWHGFSRLRLYPRVFLIWVGVLFIAVVFLEIFRKENYFALAFVLASLGFAATLTAVDVDAAIIRRNVARVEAGKHFNPGHLASLSTDAIPELVGLYNSESISDETRVRLGAVLLCYIHSGGIGLEERIDWRSLNYSYWQAANLLREVEPLLSGYKVSGRVGAKLVRDPNGAQYECQGEY